MDCRSSWVDATSKGCEPDVPEPTATRLEPDDFRDATVLFAFRKNKDKTAWEVATMYVDPSKNEEP